MKKIFVFSLIAIVAAVGCNNLELPADWQEQNVKSMGNANFEASVTAIDPQQSWNMAEATKRLTRHITVSELKPEAGVSMTKAGGGEELKYDPTGDFPQYYKGELVSTNTSEDIKSSMAENADFFILQEGNSIPIEFNGMDCWAKTTLGIYYYDWAGNLVEKELFSDVVGKIYIGLSGTSSQQAAERAKTEGLKSLQLEDGQAFGVYIITHTGPDVDSKTYKTNVTNKYYSEAALNPDGKSHVKLTTQTLANTTTYTYKKYKVTVSSYTKCKAGDDYAVTISKEGYYYCNDKGKLVETNKYDILHPAKFEVKKKDLPAYYKPVFSIKEDGTTTEQETSPFHYKYTIDFEDGTDDDYDDVSLKVNTSIMKGSGKLLAVDRDCGPWIILCEDLGQGADNDFNDIVFRVHRTAPDKMKVAFLAGGATRQDYVLFDAGAKLFAEIHDVFGVNINWDKDYGEGSTEERPNWFINTMLHEGRALTELSTWSKAVYSGEITVDEQLSMSTYYRSDINNTTQGFAVKSGDLSEVPFSPAYKGYAPYLICVPAIYEEGGQKHYFRWPVECISIFDAYPEFRGWAEDHTKNVNWYMHPVDKYVIGVEEINAILGNN